MLKITLVIFTLAICGLMNVQANVEPSSSNPTEIITENDQEESLLSCDRCKRKTHVNFSFDKPFEPKSYTDRIDSIATHKFWGYILFIILMVLMFQSICLHSSPKVKQGQ